MKLFETVNTNFKKSGRFVFEFRQRKGYFLYVDIKIKISVDNLTKE